MGYEVLNRSRSMRFPLASQTENTRMFIQCAIMPSPRNASHYLGSVPPTLGLLCSVSDRRQRYHGGLPYRIEWQAILDSRCQPCRAYCSQVLMPDFRTRTELPRFSHQNMGNGSLRWRRIKSSYSADDREPEFFPVGAVVHHVRLGYYGLKPLLSSARLIDR
jgi:hypothetical protein